MTELTSAPSGAPIAGTDIFAMRKAGEAGLKKVTANDIAAFTGGGGGGVVEFNIYTQQMAPTVLGGQPVAGSWQNRPLNTVVRQDTTGASFASGIITLPAGTYKCQGFQTFYNTVYSHTRLFNVTDALPLAVGRTGYHANTTSDMVLPLDGVFTLSDTKDIALQYRVTSASNANGFGVGNGTVENAIFAQLMLEKIN
jgi:hypothetical protein